LKDKDNYDVSIRLKTELQDDAVSEAELALIRAALPELIRETLIHMELEKE